jgi:hypothetical protein
MTMTNTASLSHMNRNGHRLMKVSTRTKGLYQTKFMGAQPAGMDQGIC